MRRFVTVVAVVMLAVTCSAQEVAAPKWTGNYSVDFKTQYFGLPASATFADQKVLQQEVDVTRHSANDKTFATATLWNSTGFSHAFKTYAYETDVDFAIAHQFGKYTVSVGEWLFLLNPKAAGFNTLVFDTKASRAFSHRKDGAVPFLELQSYRITNKAAIHGGTYLVAGVTHVRTLSHRFSIASQFQEGYDADGAFGSKSGKSLFYGETALRFAPNKTTTIILPRFGVGGSWNDRSKRPTKTIWSMGFSKSF
jgi:hypothetical protein